MTTAARVVYWLGWVVFSLYYRLFYRWRLDGAENVPAAGGIILYANHASWHDIPILAISVRRPVRFLAKEELFHNRFVGAVLRLVGGIPIKRGLPDRHAIRQALQALERGEILGIFPEGTRVRDRRLGKAEPGLAYLLWKSGAPAVPVGISSPYRWFGPVTVRIGKPVHPDGWGDRPGQAELAALSDRLMQEVDRLLVTEHLRPSKVGRPRAS
ncbi:lysophospholipid acyltransferase family protein [Caldinitratiruptor microaerophilus]|uniref:1-acyl-sn-glycerol-3-phosphate acyltransferase n=1 Tax=Caldinitratiruptor microaerophilus TaxID=671077 RepID=A0AA35CJN5_9FIRM|nr:lysophospholipid acyltransferase family protein [Caldinitratiruptor microaerophilus]BDG60437.1 1-acyl-sn-glycerol-3-phosphate acyltransferase [Caldinitratiruptor microaerophilus]